MSVRTVARVALVVAVVAGSLAGVWPGELMDEFQVALLERVDGLIAARNYADAITICNQVLAKDPKAADFYYRRARCYIETGKFAEALADCTSYLKLRPNDALAYNLRGVLYYRQLKYDLALADYNKALALDPRQAAAYHNRGHVYYRQGKHDLAIADYNQALALTPTDAVMVCDRGLAYEGLGKMDLALADYTKALALNPRYKIAYNNRGWLYFQQKQYDRALADFNQAITCDPNYGLAYNNRAWVWLRKGEIAKARADADKARQLGREPDAALVAALAQAGGGTASKPWQLKGTQAGQTIVGPDGGKMVWVPPGQFQMGTDYVGRYMFSCGPVHRVMITRGFWLGKTEVSNAQYRAFCQATGRPFPTQSNQGDDRPVEFVSWADAFAYARHYGMRLPSEAEWEWAARGASGRTWPWGNTWDASRCCNRDNRPAAPQRTRPVGSFASGAAWCGALNMAGNVWEFCSDWLDKQYYTRSPVNDPPGPTSGEFRVIRGGCFDAPPDQCRSANRNGVRPDARLVGNGFRCVVVP